ncbi:MAG TPA: ATP-binding protein [Polyangiaceae bacterium]|nr:ATP-binding protein [Polyangiaceae bacterium]
MSDQGTPPLGSPSLAAEARARPAVLLVDDVEANLVALQALLADLDCELVLARSGNAALRQLLRREFALVLLDVQMPEMDGYEVAEYARKNFATKDVPILFLTATHNTQDNVLRGYDSGAVDFLFKPIDSSILRSKVRVFLELYNGKREIADKKHALEGAYRDLQAMQTQLVQSAKMASLGELVAGIAHEINNPLAFALSHLDTVLRSLGPVEAALHPETSDAARPHWEKVKSRLGEMNLGLGRIRELVVKLRTFSRLDGDERGVANLKECVDSVITILGHRLKDRIKIEQDLREPGSIECYPGLLNQALMNLMANSIDAIEGEGTIVVSAGAAGDRYVIAVSDTGHGIPAAVRHRIFEPFFTTKGVGSGTGLGLSITYSIVQKHGGTLSVDCPPTGGTTMTMSLPLVTAP